MQLLYPERGKNQSAESPIGTTSGTPPRVPRPKAEFAVKKKTVESIESRKNSRSMFLRGSKEKDGSLSKSTNESQEVKKTDTRKHKNTMT